MPKSGSEWKRKKRMEKSFEILDSLMALERVVYKIYKRLSGEFSDAYTDKNFKISQKQFFNTKT